MVQKLILRQNILKVFQRSYSTDRNYSTSLGLVHELYDFDRPAPTKTDLEDTVSVSKPYASIPGPKALPLIGNAWRFAPIIGKYLIIYDLHLCMLCDLFDFWVETSG